MPAAERNVIRWPAANTNSRLTASKPMKPITRPWSAIGTTMVEPTLRRSNQARSAAQSGPSSATEATATSSLRRMASRKGEPLSATRGAVACSAGIDGAAHSWVFTHSPASGS